MQRLAAGTHPGAALAAAAALCQWPGVPRPAPPARPCCTLQVEAFYASNGMFIPAFHKTYWIGYKTQEWPNFVWINNDSRADNVVSNYSHWGTYYVRRSAQPGAACPPSKAARSAHHGARAGLS